MRKKIVDVFINGKVIRIEGGNYVFGNCKYICLNCGKVFELEKCECLECYFF